MCAKKSRRQKDSPSETNRLRDILKASNRDYKWAKRVNLMTPDEISVAYYRLRQNNNSPKN